MCAAPTYESIDVQDLQVGMVVHLDGGWMAHPFPLSRFKISSAAQIATIRSLGLKRVRWEPQFSDVVGSPSEEDDAASPAEGPQPAADAAAGVADAAALA